MTALEKVESVWCDLEKSYHGSKISRIAFLKRLLGYKGDSSHGNVEGVLSLAKRDLDLDDEAVLERFNHIASIIKRADERLQYAISNSIEIEDLNEFVLSSSTEIEETENTIVVDNYNVFDLVEECDVKTMLSLNQIIPGTVISKDFETVVLKPKEEDFLFFRTETDVLIFINEMNTGLYKDSTALSQYTMYALLQMILSKRISLPIAFTKKKYMTDIRKSCLTEKKIDSSKFMLEGSFKSVGNKVFALPQIKSVEQYDFSDRLQQKVRYVFIEE